MMVRIIFLILLTATLLNAQLAVPADSLRGSLRPERTCFDVVHYDLSLALNFATKEIYMADNLITFKWLGNSDRIQLDLFENMKIDKVLFGVNKASYERQGNAFFVNVPNDLNVGETYQIRVYFSGKPIEAKNPPWDGGFTWKTDKNGNPWVGTSVQGIGASLFWPNKDHLSDEVDSMHITTVLPAPLDFVSNGNLVEEVVNGGMKKVRWKVSYPINNYNVTLNIGDYVHIHDEYISEDKESPLSLDYYVLSYNDSIAQEHFKQVKPMLKCFEQAFGPYPFWNDGYALVETPYLGMEHQSAIAYGNNYQPGYAGRHFEGFTFDYLLIHETGHEYWGNSLSMEDLADMWIHEGFCTYSESIYIECIEGYEKAMDYIANQRKLIRDKAKIQGEYGINHAGDGDMYYKGAWMLNSMRHTLGNDELWWRMIKDLTTEFEIKNVNAQTIFDHFNAYHNFQPIFNQFLNHAEAPVLLLKKSEEGVWYKWETQTPDFNMAMRVKTDGEDWLTIHPSNEFQLYEVDGSLIDQLIWGERFFYFKIRWE